MVKALSIAILLTGSGFLALYFFVKISQLSDRVRLLKKILDKHHDMSLVHRHCGEQATGRALNGECPIRGCEEVLVE